MKVRLSSTNKQSPESILEYGRQSLGASSCIFYVRDPWWTDQFVQVFMPGVEITEPMHGFVFPLSSYTRVVGPDSGEETYFENAAQSEELSDHTMAPLSNLVKQNSLFGNFVEREKVGSCVRLRHFSPDGKVGAVLWINFSKPKKKFEKQKIRNFMNDIVECLPGIIERLQIDNPFPIAQLVQILKPAEQLATIGQPLTGQRLEWYLDKILEAVLRAFNIQEETGLGTIQLFDPTTLILRRVAHRGYIDEDAVHEQHVSKGEGVISWVALKRRAILISDLEMSPFKDTIYKRIAPDIVSELAVPMLAGDELLGVLNLESRVRPSPFSAHSVRTIWYAANQAAIACRLSQQVSIAQEQTDRTSRLLEIAHNALAPAEASKPLDELAELARDWLQAAECDVWQYRESSHRFTDSGASYGHHPAPFPRDDGWTHYVRLTKTPVWIFDVVNLADFKYKLWDHDKHSWNSSPPEKTPPQDINQRVVDLNIRCELGMPILVGDRCIGVAWLRYLDENTPEPTLSSMNLAAGFAAQAGLVIDVLQHHNESAQKVQALREYRDRLFPTGAFSFPGIQCYVIRHACGEVGGDFHAFHEVDAKRTSFLVGDAEGHDILGALYMLPMITTFRGFSRESCSTKHILWRLLPVCERWQLRGTAICFIVDMSGKRPLIFASSAGHHSLIIAKEHAQNFDFPNRDGVANRGALGIGLDLPIGEEVCELSSGDLVIAYTDGVLEPNKDNFPVERIGIVEAVLAHFSGTPETIARAIEEKVMTHAHGHLHDDATIMVLRVE